MTMEVNRSIGFVLATQDDADLMGGNSADLLQALESMQMSSRNRHIIVCAAEHGKDDFSEFYADMREQAGTEVVDLYFYDLDIDAIRFQMERILEANVPVWFRLTPSQNMLLRSRA